MNKDFGTALNFFRNKWIILSLWGVIAFYFTTNFIWLSYDNLPSSWDQSAHLNHCLNYLRILSHPFSLSNLSNLLDVTHYWPPFFYISSVPLLMVFGFSYDVVVLTNSLYLVILVFSIYKIGEYFFNNIIGLGAVLITLLYPMVYALSRELLLDFPLLSMVSLAQYIILISRSGMNRRGSWLLGIAMGFALLTKWTAIAFLIGTWLFTLFETWLREKRLRREMAISLTIASGIFFMIIFPWYIRASRDLLKGCMYSNLIDAVREGDPTSFSLRAFIWYWDVLKDVLISKAIMPFTLLGLLSFIIWVRRWDVLGFILSWILPAYLIFVALPNKDGRFIVPLLPAISILTSAGIYAVPGKTIKRIIWFFLILIGIIQFFMISFGWPKQIYHYYTHPPLKQDWKAEEILKTLYISFLNGPLTIGFLPNHMYFNPNIFLFYINLWNLPYHVIVLGDTPITDDILKECDILITKTASMSIRHTALYREQFFKLFKEESPEKLNFMVWKRFSLPDETEAEVYIRKDE